jgi:cyanophycin synthetase
MDVVAMRRLDGVNRWFTHRALEAVISEVPDGSVPEHIVKTLAERFDRLSIPPHRSGSGHRLQQTLRPDSRWGFLISELASELQSLCGDFAASRAAKAHAEPGVWSVVLRCLEFPFAEACVCAALRVCGWLRSGQVGDLAGIYDQLVALSKDVCLGGGTGPIVAAARRRGIPTYRLDQESLVQLGEGVHQRRVCAAITSQTGFIAVQLSNDKEVVKALWSRIGIPVAAGRLVRDEEDAVEATRELGWPLVVKPRDADFGKGVSLKLKTAEEVRTAYRHAHAFSKSGGVLVERHLPGMSHRLLVVNDSLVAAVLREPPTVVGDGLRTVRELVELANQDVRRGEDYRWPLRRLRLEEQELAVLAAAGFTQDSIVASGQSVVLRSDLHTWSGTVNKDVSELVHPETRDLARDAVRIIGLDVAGVDVVASDISRPLHEQSGGFLEVNAEPATYLHLAPICDRPRLVGEAIVASLFPAQSSTRVPLVLAIGQDLADCAGRLLAALLSGSGRHVATSGPDLTMWNNRRLVPAGTSLPDRLHSVMLHPQVDAAVVKATLTDVAQNGLGTDRCQVLVLAECQTRSEPGRDDSHEARSLIRHLMTSARCCVVNIDDPSWERYIHGAFPSVLMVSSNPEHPRLLRHLREGRLGAFPRGQEVVIRAGETEVVRFSESFVSTAGDSTDSVMARILAAAGFFALNELDSN